MNKQEYMDLSDLQLMRAALGVLQLVNAQHQPNRTRVMGIRENLRLCIDHLELLEFIDG